MGATNVRERGNPLRQALGATHALSDELHAFADSSSAPAPRGGKFYSGIDAIVCAFPKVPDGSRYEEHKHVAVLGYDTLLDRLRSAGPCVPWSGANWDAFARHLNLYRADEDSPEGIVGWAGTAAVDEYRGRYLQAQTDLPPLVPTGVTVNGRSEPRPDLAAELAAGRGALLSGPSEFGKTLWARTATVELANAGHVPIWLAADVCDDSFRTSVARAIAPYTSLSPGELLGAAEAAGRSVVFVIDDLTKASERVRQALLDGAQAVRLRNPTRGLLITSQDPGVASSIADCLDVALAAPEGVERRAVLDAYGAPEIVDRCAAFVSPLELSLAAENAGELEPGVSSAALIDRHIDRLVDGDDRVRDGLRIVARRMHSELSPSLPRPDLARRLRRDYGITDAVLQAVLACPIVSINHGRVSFRHERFEHVLAAEALLLDAHDADALARTLNTPRCAELRSDAAALETHQARLSTILSACEHPDVLVDAVTGRLGLPAARLAEVLLVNSLNTACTETSAPGITFQVGDGLGFRGGWTMPSGGGDAASAAQLIAIGRLLRRGRFVEGAARLLHHTDHQCAAVVANADPSIRGLADQAFAATYALHGLRGLPASEVVHAATEPLFSSERDLPRDAQAATALLSQRDAGPGALYVAGRLLHQPSAPPIVADVIVKCLASGRYHLLLLGLQLAADSAHSLDGSTRHVVLDAIRSLPSDNIFLNSSIVDALSGLGDITPARDLDDIATEIATVLSMQNDPLGRKMAYGIISAQFETEAIGPYYEAVRSLPDGDRERLLAMALAGDEADGFSIPWILGEFDDLSDPFTRAAVVAYVARTNPKNWFGAQWGMEGVVIALRLLVEEGVPLPDPMDDGNSDPAWRAAMTVIMGVLADASSRPFDAAAVDAAWETLVGDRRATLASLLVNLGQMHGMHFEQPEEIHDHVIAAMPASGIDVLIWSLEHPDKIRSLCRHDRGLPHYLIGLLGRLGDRRVADVLRRFTNEPDVGEAAAAAVRAIETRAVA